MFEFTLPLSQKALTWKPLTVGQQLDAQAANKGGGIGTIVDMFCRRVIKFDDKPGLTIGQIREWDQIDFDAFTDHVNKTEADRASQFQKPMLQGDALLILERAQVAFEENVKVMREAIDGAIAAVRQAGSAGPLK